MIIKFRRGFILVALVVIGAILLSLEGWRRLMRSEWLQQIAQQQLAAKFGDSLHYQQLEASLAGVRLRHVTYASPDHSLTVTIEEINVGFQLWDLLKNLIYHRHSEHVGATENVEVDSLSAHPLSGYRLDISINRPCLILLGSWNSRLQSWTQAQRQASSPASAPQLIQPCSSPDRTSSSSSAAVAPMADSATRPITPNATSRSWNLEFIRKLEVSDGQILFDPQDGNEPVLLADAIEGNLDPTVSAKHSATAPKSEAQWSGKLLAADQYNFFIRALIDMKSGRIDSVKVVLHEVVLQQLHNLWKLWDRLSRDTRSGTKVVLANDSTAQPVATREAFDKDWQIGSGVLNGRILLWPRPREHGKAVLAYAREQNPQHADAASVHASADRASISTWMSGFQASGELELRDGEVRFGEHVPVTMTVTNFHAELKDDTLKLRSNQQINQQLVQLSGGVRFSETRQPELDLIVTSDSMNTAEFLRPFLQAGENTNQQTQTGSTDSTLSRFPISGLAAFSGRISGSVRSPKLEAEIHSPQLKFYGQPVRNLAMQLAYTVQQHAGAADSSLKLVSGFGELDGLLCRGWGELYLWRPQRPLQLHLVAEGELTTHLKNLLPVDLPRCGATIEAQISGPLNDPRTTGQFTLRILGDQDFKKASPFPQPIERGSFLGNFSFYHDTLRIETNVEPSLQEVESRGMIVSARDHKSSDSPGLELSVEIWKHPSGGLTAGKMGSSSKPPLFRIRGQGIPLLSTVFGTAFPGSLFSNLEVDAYLEGRSDSINIRIDGRNHTAGGYTLFQLFGYFRTLGEAQRLVSGDLKIFPGAYNEIKATYSAVWQDSVFSITDVRAGDWLVGGLEIATRGTRALNGGVKIKRADISHLLEGVAREVHQYVGKLFAEFHVGGTIDTPCVEGDFWILDALFNGIGKFSISGKARLDGRGWEISTLEVRKNNQPFLQGAVSYQWATHTPHLELQAHDIEISEFLGAIAGVPPDIMTGRMSCELKTVDSWRGPDGGMRLPLTGFVRIQNGRIVWFMFDEISMHADAVRLAASTSAEIPDDKSFSYLGNNGIFFSRVGYEKSGAFTLAGSAYLPFNLKDFVNLSLSGDGNFLAILPDLTSFFQQTKSQGHLDLNLVGPYKNLTMRNSYLRFQDGFLKMSRVAPEAHDISGEAFVDNRGRFIQIFNLQGKVGDAILQVYNQESPPP
ncbi:MAG: hypothetical protein ONB45_04950, partial [candidate division KSB1 bacterium]|nr:hypothetical protein [candidate division KSB1 bacterium]